MKKIFSVLSTLFFCSATAYAQMTPLLPGTENEVAECRASQRSQKIDFFGINTVITQTVVLQSDQKCRVQSVADNDFALNTTTCLFTQTQLDEIRAANADDGQKTYTVNISFPITDENGTKIGDNQMEVRGTLQEVTWARFLNDPATCVVETQEKDPTADFKAALAGCGEFKRKLDVFGFKAEVGLAPTGNQLCRYSYETEIPAMTASINEENRDIPSRRLSVDCLLNSEQLQELAKWLEKGEPYRYRFNDDEGENSAATLMLPEKWVKDAAFCTVTSH